MKSIEEYVKILHLDADEEAIRELSESEVKDAYRERVKDTHPDQGGSLTEFKQVKEASNMLLNFVESERQSSYTQSSSKNTTTSSQQAEPSKSSSTTSYTYQRRTKNQYKKESSKSTHTNSSWADSSTQSKTRSSTTSSTNTTDTQSTETQNSDTDSTEDSHAGLYDTYYNGSMITTVLNTLSYIIGSLNIMFLFALGVLLSSGYIYVEEYVAYNIPYMGQITVEMVALSLTITPLVILLDLRYNKLNSIQLFNELPADTIRDIAGLDGVISYSMWYKILLIIISFSGTTVIVAQYTQLALIEMVLIQSACIFVYSIFRKQVLTISEVRIRRETNK